MLAMMMKSLLWYAFLAWISSSRCSCDAGEEHREEECTVEPDGSCTPRSSRPYYWIDYTLGDFWESLDCDEIFRQERPIHSPATWLLLRQTYQSIVGEEHSTIAPLSSSETGFAVAFRASQSPGKGRGVFAAQHVPRGALVWSTRQTARFTTGHSYRQFLMSLEADLACDVIQWAYVQAVDDEQQTLMMSVDLDEGILVNSGDGDGESANVGCDPAAAEALPGGCKENYFALRDIEAGEEFLLDYGDFAVTHGWKEFGLE